MKKLLVLCAFLVGCPAYAYTVKHQDNRDVYTLGSVSLTLSGNVTDTLTIGALDNVSFQCKWSGVVGNQPQYQLQVSNDESEWDNIVGTLTTATSGTGTSTWIIEPFSVEYARVNILEATASGSLACVATGQRR